MLDGFNIEFDDDRSNISIFTENELVTPDDDDYYYDYEYDDDEENEEDNED
ncbi:MAG: hypothetical protein RR073_00185 [Clostridia bacterium]